MSKPCPFCEEVLNPNDDDSVFHDCPVLECEILTTAASWNTRPGEDAIIDMAVAAIEEVKKMHSGLLTIAPDQAIAGYINGAYDRAIAAVEGAKGA